jgi:hypothetical protein
MRTFNVVVNARFLNDHLRSFEAVEEFAVQNSVPELGLKRSSESILTPELKSDIMTILTNAMKIFVARTLANSTFRPLMYCLSHASKHNISC